MKINLNCELLQYIENNMWAYDHIDTWKIDYFSDDEEKLVDKLQEFHEMMDEIIKRVDNWEEYRPDWGDIDPPSIKVIMDTQDLIKPIVNNKIPLVRIDPTAEEGMYLLFRDRGGLAMHLELYNDGDVGYILEDDRDVIENEDITFDEILPALKRIFT